MRSMAVEIITINSKNINTYDHCLIKNTQADGYIAKSTWIKAELKNGLVIKTDLGIVNLKKQYKLLYFQQIGSI